MITEADYICFLAKNISLELYQNGGFVVLPRLANEPKSVYFPDLKYSSRFWNLIENCKAKNLGDSYPQNATDEVSLKLSINKISHITKKDGLEIDLLETEYGTVGSYFVKDGKIFMTRRLGNSNSNFERTFLLAKLKLKNKDNAEIGDIAWIKRDGVAEYFFDKKKNTPKTDLVQESNKYLEKLGFLTDIDISKFDQSKFTVQETMILDYLFEEKGKIVTFDKVADILWGDGIDSKYSLEAMAKVIENLRKKIKKLGVMKEVIFTKRGKGYLINL